MSGSSSELTKSHAVRAGAGAGKTTRLTKQVLTYASEFRRTHGRLPRLAVTTFTRKATEELRERLIREAVLSRDEQLLQFTTSSSYLHISTIHGVLSLFLRRFGQLLGIDPGFTIVEEGELRVHAARFLRKLLTESEGRSSLLEHYTFSEITDIFLMYAEAKERRGDFPAATEADLLKCLDQKKKDHARALKDAASFCSNEAKLSELSVRLMDLATWLETQPATEIFKDGERFGQTYETFPRYSKTWNVDNESYKEIRSLFNKDLIFWSDKNNSPEGFQLFAELCRQIESLGERFIEEMRDLKRRRGELTISDLEVLSGQAVARFPDVARAFSLEWNYWLIDEFQDTSPFQVELLKGLIGDRPRFIVGDPQQSIYLFRGARSEVFGEQQQEVIDRGGIYEELPINYRSKPELLEFFNEFFTSLDKSFMRMQPRDPVTEPQSTVAYFLNVPEDEEDPYAGITSHLLDGLAGGEQPGDYCILARTNRELFEAALALERRGVSTYLHSSEGFFERREILDLLSLMKFLINPHDDINFVRLFRSPWLRIADEKIAEIANHRAFSFWKAALEISGGLEPVKKVAELMAFSREAGVPEALRTAVINWGFIDFSNYHDPTGRREANIWKLISLLNEKARAPGFNPLQFVDRALESWDSVYGDEESDAVAATEPNRVQLMTVHKSKGLKFKHVILLNTQKEPNTKKKRKSKELFVEIEDSGKFTVALYDRDEDKLKHNLVAEAHFEAMRDRELKESLRLLYVALTRATDSVVLHRAGRIHKNSWANHISWDLSEGLHKTPNFSYLVSDGTFAAAKVSAKKKVMSAPRAPWKDDAAGSSERNRRLSVTRLLEESSGTQDVVHAQDGELMEHLMKPVTGTKVHETLERLRINPDFDARAYLSHWLGKHAEKSIQWIARLMELNEPPLSRLFENGHVEWGFQYKSDKGIIEGQIDLWGIVDETVWILDYKTGSSRYADKAMKQLKVYGQALREYLSEAEPGRRYNIRLAALFASDDKVVVEDYSPTGLI